MKKEEIKQYGDYEISRPKQLDLFSFANIFPDKKINLSAVTGLYDIAPKYPRSEIERMKKNGKNLSIYSQEFVHEKQKIRINITPARLIQKDGSTKDFFPSQREEIIEDVLRKFATDPNRNDFLNDRLAVKFTLYELWKELKKEGHELAYWQIRESLNILIKTNIEIKFIDNKIERITFSSNMFETFKEINENEEIEDTEKYNKNIWCFVRFNSLVSESVKNGTWRGLNYKQCMSYKKSLSRYLHKRLSITFRGKSTEDSYNIMLSTIIIGSGMTEYKQIGDSIIQVKKCLEEMIKIGSIKKYKMEKIYSKERKNKIEDVKFFIYVSELFLEATGLGKLALKDSEETKETKTNNNSEHQNQQHIKETTQKITFLMNHENIPIETTDIEKLLSSTTPNRNIILNAKACIEYIKNQEQKDKKCKTIAILTEAIKNNWQPNKTEQINPPSNPEITREKIEKFITSQSNKKIKSIFEKLLSKFGDNIFTGWIMHMKYLNTKNNTLIFTVETEFIKEWIIRNFLNGTKKKKDGKTIWITKGIQQLCQETDPNIKKVEITFNGNN